MISDLAQHSGTQAMSSFRLTHSLSLQSGSSPAQGTMATAMRLRFQPGLPNGASRGRPIC